MKSNELRIGNWLNSKSSNCLFRKGDFQVQPKHFVAPYDLSKDDDVYAIPLTEEWLIRFGFEYLRPKKGTLGVYSNGKAKVCLSNGGNVYTMRGKSLPYVHTLQNWYYYDQLTSEELKTKE